MQIIQLTEASMTSAVGKPILVGVHHIMKAYKSPQMGYNSQTTTTIEFVNGQSLTVTQTLEQLLLQLKG